MATISSSALVPTSERHTLQDAVRDFRSVLNESQRRELKTTTTVPNADAILIFTAELDFANRQRKGTSFASRLHRVLSSVGQFCAIIGTYVSSNPEIAALIWGSIKLTILIIMNLTSYFEATSNLFMTLGNLCPLFSEYQILYPNSTRLQRSLDEFYASIVCCCKHLVEAIQRPWHSQIFKALRTSFDQEFEPDLDDVQRCSNKGKDEMKLAQAQADIQDHQLQERERQEASDNRSAMRNFFSRTDHGLRDLQDMQMQSNERELRKRRAKVIKSLSTYDHMRVFKQSCRKRYGNTTSWIFDTPQFQKWVGEDGFVLWCSGKIGSGKTITTASAIQHILKSCDPQACTTSFFFVQSDDSESLSASTILRSLVRQRLDETKISREMVNELQKIVSSVVQTDFVELLCNLMPDTQKSFILIDGLDECSKQDRKELLTTLSALVSSGKKIRLYLSSRTSLQDEIKKVFPALLRLSLDCEATDSNIATYVQGILSEKLEDDELKVGDPNLVIEIKQALVKGAQGMFLWAYFQIQEICSLHCDKDIRLALNSLPRDLSETFRRALYRIKSRRQSQAAQKVFQWVAASKRPLSIGELREATAIEIGQKYTELSHFYNDIDDVASWCGDLVQVDEEYHSIQFAHSTIRIFLSEEPTNSMLACFHLDFDTIDHTLGEICVTYLNFNDFKTTIAQRPKPLFVNPSKIVQTTFKPGSSRAALFAKLRLAASSPPIDLRSSSALPLRDALSSFESLASNYPFLKYASSNWLSHTRSFQQGTSKTWVLWEGMLVNGHSLAQTPWEGGLRNWKNTAMRWAYKTRHYAVMRLLLSFGLSAIQRSQILMDAARDNDAVLVDLFLRDMVDSGSINKALQAAAWGGHLNVVERLFNAKANVNAVVAELNGRTALQGAAEGGHLDIVERLLTAKANVNAAVAEHKGRTALQAAAWGGHLNIVERLLDAKADVNAAAVEYGGRTALQAAAEGGHLDIVERLLDAEANVNAAAAEHRGRTALQAAAGGGHLNVVERLLGGKADVDTAAAEHDGRTALQAAAEGGHQDIVERLLDAKADVNAAAAEYGGRTALQAAAEGGHLNVVKRLLGGKAYVNAAAAEHKGRTALQAAIEGGHLDVVERLLTAKADVNAAAAGYGGRTALQAAVEGGHLDVVERLLDAKANVNTVAAEFNGGTVLQAAAWGGHLDIVERLLDAEANVNAAAAKYRGRTALLEAVEGGHLNVVKRFLSGKADVNVFEQWTALQLAVRRSHLEFIERLLNAEAEADVNIVIADHDRWTAHQIPAEGSHLDDVKRMFTAKAYVNKAVAEHRGRTALQAAAEGGHLNVVERLLGGKADVNAAAEEYGGRTALQAAAEGGHLDIVERLLDAKADVNAAAAKYGGRTALQAAIDGGDLKIIKRLKHVGAH